MAIGDIFQVRLVTHTQQQIAINVRHYRTVAEGASTPTQGQIAAFLETGFAAPYKALMNGQASWRGVGVQRIRPTPPLLEESSTALAGAGTGGGDMQPKQVAGIITLRTLLAGLSFRGRIYLPFSGEIDNAITAVPTATYLANAEILATQLRALITVTVGAATITLQPVVFSRKLNGATNLSATVVRPFWGTQRRRGDFGRVNTLPF